MFSILSTLHSWFRPTLVALFYRDIPSPLRWRLLVLQPISLLTYSIGSLPYLFHRPFTVEYLPIAPERQLRVLVFRAEGNGHGRQLRPLHVEIHGGGFIGGLPEGLASWHERVARETGAVVVSLTYRYAPEHVFPAAIDDVDAAVRFIQDNAALRWGADPTLMTVGGSSAGGGLALASGLKPRCHGSSPFAYKAAVLLCPVLDCRISPADKPKPEGMPEIDPTRVLIPLFDSYGAQARDNGHMDNPRLHPILVPREQLPERILMCIAGIDILHAEQMEFAARVSEENGRSSEVSRIELFCEDKLFHGYHEGEPTRFAGVFADHESPRLNRLQGSQG